LPAFGLHVLHDRDVAHALGAHELQRVADPVVEREALGVGRHDVAHPAYVPEEHLATRVQVIDEVDQPAVLLSVFAHRGLRWTGRLRGALASGSIVRRAGSL
jgi:hypothetical protein